MLHPEASGGPNLCMRKIELCSLLCLLAVLSAAVNSSSRTSAVLPRDDAGARQAFLQAYKVFMHPRCVNCHPAGDAPLRGEDSQLHASFRLRRGTDGKGVLTLKCLNCHQAQNQPGLHMPPGAPYPLKDGVEDQDHRGQPRWHMPAAATPMIFEKRTAAQLCRQLLNKRQNGGLDPEQLVDHVDHDPFVLWGWNPGEGRSAPTITHSEFVRAVREWISKGAACPE